MTQLDYSESGNKKILLVTRPLSPPWDEASKNFAFQIAKSIQSFDFTILVNKSNDNLPENIHQEEIYTTNSFNFEQKMRSLFYQFLAKRKFDITHYFFTPTKLNSFFVKNFLQNKGTKTIQTIATLREDIFSDEDLKKIIFGDIIITYSEHAKKRLTGLGFKNVERIYPGINLDSYKPEEKDGSVLYNFELGVYDFVVTYPGEYARLGATDDIVNMILQYPSILRDNHIKIVFACRVKNPQDEKKKLEIIEKLKIANVLDRVIFTDTVATMPKIYNMSDIIIFPVRNMQGKFDIPLAIIEAMACGKPIIVSDLEILSEFTNNGNSVKIESGNIEQLKNEILDLYNDQEKRVHVGSNARKFVEENFDIREITEKYKKIYHEL